MNALKYFFLFTIAVLFSCSFLSSCSDDEEEKYNPQDVERTVIVYMVAENNLDSESDPNDSYCGRDLKEMIDGAKSLGKNTNLIVYADRLSKTEKPYIAKIDANGMKKVRIYDEDKYSSDPAVMKEVMQWIISNYGAKSYGLVIWGHAEGWFERRFGEAFAKGNNTRALLPDNGTDSRKTTMMINVTTFKNVLSTLPRFDYILFDCCGMLTAEVDYELRNVCDYIIGSPAEVPDFGAPYNHIMNDLFLPKDEVGKKLIDDYITYSYFKENYGVPLSVVKTSNMEALAKATMTALGKFRSDFTYPKEAPVNQCIYYYNEVCSTYRPAMYDIRDFMFRNLTTEDFNTWDKVFQNTVVYSVHPVKYWYTEYSINFNDFVMADDNFGGMSIYVPRACYKTLEMNEAIMSMEWTKIVDWSKWGWNRS